MVAKLAKGICNNCADVSRKEMVDPVAISKLVISLVLVTAEIANFRAELLLARALDLGTA